MSTPGSGNQPPQDPAQGWGQQPPAGQPGPGQEPAAQQPQQFGQAPQPGQPAPGQQPWGAPAGQPAEPKKKSAVARILPIAAGVVALIVVGIVVRNFLGGGVPEVGDCTNDSITALETVDCDSDEAAYRVAGVVDDVSENELSANADLCLADWPSSTAYAVTEDDPAEEGTGLCLEPVS